MHWKIRNLKSTTNETHHHLTQIQFYRKSELLETATYQFLDLRWRVLCLVNVNVGHGI